MTFPSSRSQPAGRATRSALHPLVQRYQRLGSEADAERILRAVEGLLRSRVRRLGRRRAEEEDLMQVARVSAMGAMARWTPDGGAAFTTYLTRTVDGGLKRHLRDTDWALHVPRGAKTLALRVGGVERRMEQRDGTRPTVIDLAEEAGVSAEEVHLARSAGRAYRSESLNQPVGESGDELAVLLPDPDGSADRDLLLAVQACARTLPPKQRLVLFLTYYGGLSQREIAERIGCSQMHVSRLLRRGLGSLRDELAEPLEPAAAA